MRKSLPCRTCDVIERYRIGWLSGPLWIGGALAMVFSMIIWPLMFVWPVLALMAFAEAVRFAVCSACKLVYPSTA